MKKKTGTFKDKLPFIFAFWLTIALVAMAFFTPGLLLITVHTAAMMAIIFGVVGLFYITHLK